jgi:hypothetical protein
MARFAPAVSAQDETLKEMAIELYPLLQQLSQVGDQDLEFAGWKYLLLIIERHMGSERFEEVVNSYMKERGWQ